MRLILMHCTAPSQQNKTVVQITATPISQSAIEMQLTFFVAKIVKTAERHFPFPVLFYLLLTFLLEHIYANLQGTGCDITEFH